MFWKKFSLDTVGGSIMLLFASFAIILSNSRFAEYYSNFLQYKMALLPLNILGYSVSDHLALNYPISLWVQDGLMAIFFWNVAMDLKVELREGLLTSKKQIALPLVAAVAGMAVPALVYYIINVQYPQNYAGIAVPCATDIAFALCIFNLFAKTVPLSAKIFLLSIAIFDDLGAILLILLFYGKKISLIPLLLSILAIASLFTLNYFKVRKIGYYLVFGVFLWYCFDIAGIHATMAGVILGFALPLYDNQGYSLLKETRKIVHPLVVLIILPFFAFTACNINLSVLELSDLSDPIALGIAAGLFIGKQIGIFGISFILIKLDVIPIPDDARWIDIYVVACLTGIGFTMSLFIGELAFDSEYENNLVKAGMLAGTILSTIWSILIVKMRTP